MQSGVEIGAVGPVILGTFMFGGAASPLRLGAIAVITLGIAMLKFAWRVGRTLRI